jgi:Domain of unknown function (DUF1707)
MILSEADQRAAIAALQQAARDGELDSEELARRTADVWRCNTPRDLWRATGGRAGAAKRSDTKEIRHALLAMLFLIAFAFAGAALVTWGMILYARGH